MGHYYLTTINKSGGLKRFSRLLLIMVCAILTLNVSAQTRKITGTVIDDAGDPMAGVSVMIKGTNQGVATDLDGKYSLNASTGSVLEFSYIGYLTKSVTIGERSVINITMNEDIKALDEVVVVAYGTASKESLTGSVAVISDKDIQRRPVTSVTSALEGMAPGVQVNGSTGTPGESPSILIRGINSINGTTAPLYVVDGVIWNGEYNDINPNDVENISVLKDAASCALYGAKGANGVVLITTKCAKNTGNVEVTAKVRQGIYQRALPEYKRLGYDRWNEAMLQAITNGKVTSSPDIYTYESARKETIGNFFSDAGVLNLYNVFEKNADGSYVLDSEGNKIHNISGSGEDVFDANGKVIASRMAGYDDTDWWDAISRNGHRQEYNLSATGASDKYNAYASIGYVKEKGYLLKTDFERFNARLNAEFQPTKYLKVGAGVTATEIESNQAQFDTDNLSSTSNAMSYQGLAPGLPYYSHNWNTGELLRDENGKPIWNTMDGYPAFVSNKGYILRSNSEDYERISVDANAFATIILPYNFEFTVRGTTNRYREENTSYDSPLIGSAKDFGRLTKYFYKRETTNIQQYLTWSHEYGAHHVDAMLNHESYSRYYTYTYVKNKNELFPDKLYISNFTENEGTGAYAYRYRTETFMGRARYNWNNQYFLEASLSRDASSKFAKDNRWGTFWSVGASWIMSKEKFLKDVEWINQLKLRAAYGTAGNDYTSNYYPTYDLWTKFSSTLDGNPSVFPSTLGNPNIKWESTKTLDLALEGYFFNSRLNASVGFFSRVNADLLFELQQAPSNGVDGKGESLARWQNIGNMRNTGWEILISGDIITNKNFSWSAHVDATFIKNKITKLPAGNLYNSPRALIEGRSRYEYYTYKWAGVDMLTGKSLYEINENAHQFQTNIDEKTGEITDWHFDKDAWELNLNNAEKAGNLVKIGDRYYSTSTSFASKHFRGTSLPTVYGSFGTNLRWKGLSVNALFTYRLGGKTLNTVYSGMLSPNAGKSLHEDAITNTWTPDMANGIGENDANRVNRGIRPQINTVNASNNNASSDRFLISSSYLAFKNLNITYDLPKKWITPLSLKGLSAGLSIDNVKLFTKMDGMNPTYNNAGGQGDYFVPSRVYSFEITARF